MGKLIPLILAVLGTLGGAGAGYFLRDPGAQAAATTDAHGAEPAHDAPAAEEGGHGEAAAPAETSHDGETAHGENEPEFVKLSNQFVVPVVEGGRVTALVILSLSLEVAPGATEAVYAREPKLRDAFLQVLFDHANAGGFRGSFTDGANLVALRTALLEVAQRTVADRVKDVLIVDIARQDS